MGVIARPMPWEAQVPPCVPPSVSSSHSFGGILLLLLAFFLALFPVPLTINPLCLCSGHILHGGRRLKLPLWISFLLLSDICISGCGLSEFCSSPLKHLHLFWAWSHHAFHKYILDPLSKASIRMLDRSRCWPELSQASAALGMSHY